MKRSMRRCRDAFPGRARSAGAGLALALCLPVCATHPEAGDSPDPAPLDTPYVLVLGTAQDGGLPQIGCNQPCCRAARADPRRRRAVSSLLLADPRSGQRYLLDATPDLREQVERAAGHPATRVAAGPRPPLFEGIFLTHAHMGHYLGLAQLGPEAYGASSIPVHGTELMLEFLQENAPWDLLLRTGVLLPERMQPEVPVRLAADLTVTPVLVPHRREYTDTCALVVRGPRRSLLYLPDIDKWERWDRAIEDLLHQVDVALLDGSFYAEGEIPGRSMAEIPHPFVQESLARFAALPPSERSKIWFTHLNHTNPAADPESEAAAAVRRAGMRIAEEGMIVPL